MNNNSTSTSSTNTNNKKFKLVLTYLAFVWRKYEREVRTKVIEIDGDVDLTNLESLFSLLVKPSYVKKMSAQTRRMIKSDYKENHKKFIDCLREYKMLTREFQDWLWETDHIGTDAFGLASPENYFYSLEFTDEDFKKLKSIYQSKK